MISAEDQLAIIAIVSRADDLATARDANGYAALYSTTGSIGGSEGDFIGRDGIRAGVIEVWAGEPMGTHHLTTTVSIDEIDADTVIARSTLLLIGDRPLEIFGMAQIAQTFTRSSSGWLISRREIRS